MNVAIIDDQEFIRYSVKKILKKKNLNVFEYEGNEDYLMEDLKNNSIEVLLLDVMLEFEKTGIDILEEIRKASLDIEVILMTAFTTPDNVIRANKLEVLDILKKPFEEDELLDILEQIIQNSQKNEEQIISLENEQTTFVGSFETMKNIYKQIGVAAKNNLTVLVTGETGTGKELVAQLIHENSPKSKDDFISINCASIPADLFESQLFGHEKGSFTGATSEHIGYAQQVGKGTLFLDEIGELDINLQSKILRFLENRTFRRIGGYKEFTFEGRIIAATNINFKQAIEENKFREDLYFRLSMLNIHLPSLQQRKDDIPLLVEHFIQKANNDLKSNVLSISKDAMDILNTNHWKGNIRELRNSIYNAVLSAKQETILHTDLAYIDGHKEQRIPSFDFDLFCLNQLEQKGIEKAIEIKANMDKAFLNACVQSCSNLSHLSSYLNISRSTLRKRLKEYGIQYQD